MFVPNFTLSGYGDRMIDLFLLSILSSIYKEPVDIVWEEFNYNAHKQTTPEWRSKDTNLKTFLSFFKLPVSLRLYPYHPRRPYANEIVITRYFGGTISPYAFLNKIQMPNVQIEDLKKEFSLQVPLYTPPTPYAVLHLRRSDKVRQTNTDEGMIHQSELDFLDQETKVAIRTCGFRTFYIASDEINCKKEYTDFLISQGYEVLEPPNIHNLLPSYFDTWMMFSSSLIVVSMRYSNFSLFPALFRNIPLYTVLPPDRYYDIGFQHHVNITYYKDIH